ncbi:stage V sporulation protein AC [Paenibacillus darwinianus]|uniref:Stage V sporulation protein AC n=1 Tax=Paenibacillus darwinianus TaxID=1380763 RepID=A0A9W5S0R3_9BACL|nr:stage V sporulation protein AC [Paenibacillus darwinianus]EXX88898.1 stage V sporulation protein AC [Paenibacillus darwinianus]EXX89096.1 stage V sporulation protein AC [Paenibacillus darwinianus]EXX90427.1 stage V sporulation protein AC [Paenibacillus darwinianus]
MSNGKNNQTTPTQKEYQALAKKREPSRPVVSNCIKAFLVGGLISIIGQAIQDMFVNWGGFDRKEASNPTVAVLILISVILTSLGVYDKIAQWAGAGSAVPVTGFANTMASAAIEHRSEGLVLGVGGKMFKLSGPVIVFGTVAAFVVGIVHWIFDPGSTGGS